MKNRRSCCFTDLFIYTLRLEGGLIDAPCDHRILQVAPAGSQTLREHKVHKINYQ